MYHLKMRNTDNLRAINMNKRRVARIEKIRFFTYLIVSDVISFSADGATYRFDLYTWGVVDSNNEAQSCNSAPSFIINSQSIAGYERFKDRILARVVQGLQHKGVLKMTFPLLCDIDSAWVALCIVSVLKLEYRIAVHLEMGEHEYTIKILEKTQ